MSCILTPEEYKYLFKRYLCNKYQLTDFEKDILKHSILANGTLEDIEKYLKSL